MRSTAALIDPGSSNGYFIRAILSQTKVPKAEREKSALSIVLHWTSVPSPRLQKPLKIRKLRLTRAQTHPKNDDRWDVFCRHYPYLPKFAQKGFEEAFGTQPSRKKTIRWQEIQKLYALSGFKIFPVSGAISDPWYFFLISQKYMPVSFRWEGRVPQTAVDVFHEIGHALALLDRSYRTLFLRFGKVSFDAWLFQSRKTPKNNFNRLFEYASARKSKSYLPIGAIAMMAETFLTPDPDFFEIRPEYRKIARPFSSKRNWMSEVERIISLIESN